MASGIEPFELQVLATSRESGLWVSATSRLGSVLALPVAPETTGPLQSPGTMAKWFRDTVASGGRNVPRAQQDGIALRDATFGIEEIGALLRRTRGAAAAAGRPVLLRLFAAPAETAALPWELLADPDQPDQPLALATDVHFARVAQVRTYPLRDEPVIPPINLLLVLSNPSLADGEVDGDNTQFDHYEERRKLLAELRPLQERGLLSVTIEDRPSLDHLRRRIAAEPRGFHVIHYLGHARPQQLKLEGEDGRPAWTDSAVLGELLRRGCPDLRLVVFAGCQTAVAPDLGSETVRRTGSSITDSVVQDACPTVVGMQAVLPFRTEQIFARVFYQSLCSGRSIAHAVNSARVAIRADDVVGGALLDWAVPILVTGDLAGPLVDQPGQAGHAEQPSPPSRSAARSCSQLKLGLDEPDREFFARFWELRTVLDVLGSYCPERVVVITGGPGVGKTRLLARALDEIESDATSILYVHASRLARPGPDGIVDPVAALCRLVAELLGQGHERSPDWSSADWWERLIEQLVGRSFVLAVDDIDRVEQAVGEPLGDAIASLVKRRSRSRVVLTAQQQQSDLLGRAARYAVLVRLEPVTERDVTQWIRRNRPRLATLLLPRTSLVHSLFRTKLSSRLELWSALAEELAGQDLVDDSEVVTLADKIFAQHPEEPTAPQPVTTPAVEGATTTTDGSVTGRVRSGPLRVVITGPHTSGRSAEFAKVIADQTAKHGIAGRVVTGDGPDQITSIVTLLDTESPFDGKCKLDSSAIVRWLDKISNLEPDVVLLDYAGTEEDAAQTEVLRRLADRGTLLVAAGGMGDLKYPANLDFVLSVGALDDDGRIREFSPWLARQDKPDIYAHDNLDKDALAIAVREKGPTQGTSFAALRVMVASVLVWAVDRTQTAQEVRTFLTESGSHIRGRRRTGHQPRQLDEAAAVEAARASVVLSALKFGALDASGLSVASGLDAEVISPIASNLLERNMVQAQGGRYELTTEGQKIAGTRQLR